MGLFNQFIAYTLNLLYTSEFSSIRQLWTPLLIYDLIDYIYDYNRYDRAGDYKQPVIQAQVISLKYIVQPGYIYDSHLEQNGGNHCQVKPLISPYLLPKNTLILKPEIKGMEELGKYQGGKYHSLEQMGIIFKYNRPGKIYK